MKNSIKLLSLGLFLLGITASRAQLSNGTGGILSPNVPNTNTNVGIGTTSPTNALTVQKVSGGSGVSGTDGTGGVRVNWASGYGVALDAWDGNEPKWGITSFSGNTPTVILEGKYSSKDVYFNSGGNVGIGTAIPAALLDLQKSYGNDVGIKLSQPGSSVWDIKNTASTGLFTIGAGGAAYFNIDKTNGYIGIGTTTPDEKLAVNGNIHSKEVRVDLTGWPDYVFTKAYDLPALKEVEKHILEKGHLQNIPSAEEVALKGVLLGDMNSKLLQKIEELTLYAIEQQKELERLKTENENYKSLSERLSAIENELKK